jgi:hypothetical protein
MQVQPQASSSSVLTLGTIGVPRESQVRRTIPWSTAPGTEMPAHVQRLPAQGGMRAEQLLHGLVGVQELGMDLPMVVEPRHELALCGSKGENRGQPVATLCDQIHQPPLGRSSRSRQLWATQRRHETAPQLDRVRIHVADRDCAPVPPARAAVDNEGEAKPAAVEIIAPQQLTGVEEVATRATP